MRPHAAAGYQQKYCKQEEENIYSVESTCLLSYWWVCFYMSSKSKLASSRLVKWVWSLLNQSYFTWFVFEEQNASVSLFNSASLSLLISKLSFLCRRGKHLYMRASPPAPLLLCPPEQRSLCLSFPAPCAELPPSSRLCPFQTEKLNLRVSPQLAALSDLTRAETVLLMIYLRLMPHSDRTGNSVSLTSVTGVCDGRGKEGSAGLADIAEQK